MEYLNEESYESGKSKLKVIICIILIVGLAIGGGLIYLGINRTNPERIESLTNELNVAKEELVTLKNSLQTK